MDEILRKNVARSSQTGFTLVELLVVVTIIGLLVGLISVAVPKAIESGMKAKAKGELTSIVAAVKAYKQEYGRFPGDLTQSNCMFSSNSTPSVVSLINVLSGDSTNTLGDTQPANPKGVRFFEGSKGGTNGLPDPWDKQYMVIVDTAETGTITYTNAGTAMNLRLSVLAFSYGKDGKADTATGAKNDIFSTDLK
jgi:prepilin-type N-terminal cleavage/methylation domain-containing protein